jgi:CBS domain containing-hemolysin-like protein
MVGQREMFGEWLIFLALVNLGLFGAAAGAALVSAASNWLAERVGTDGWQTWALWTRRAAQALTLLLAVAVIGATVALAAFFLLPPVLAVF